MAVVPPVRVPVASRPLAEATGRARRVVDPDPRADPWLTALLVLSACEPAHTPLRWITDAQAARWWFLVPLWIAAAMVGLADGRGLRGAVRAPARWLLAAAVWMMLVSPVGLVPHLDLATSAGLAAFVLAGCAVVEVGGWPRMRAALFPASVILLSASALTELSGLDGERWMGVFRDANALALGCVVAAVSGLDRWMRRRGAGGLLLMWSSIPLLLLSDGRMAMVALVVALAVVVRPALPRGFLTAALVVGLVAGAWLLADGSRREQLGRSVSRSGDTEELATVTGRTAIWEVALRNVGDRPLTGVGAGSTPEVFASAPPDGRIEYFEVVHGHDLWVQLALSGGIPAVVLVALGGVGYARRAARRPIRDREALVLAIVIQGLTEDVVAEPHLALLVVAAAFASVSRRTRASSGGAPGSPAVAGQATQTA
jgi:O-antigen ligase